MGIINNRNNNLLGDDLKAELKDGGGKLRIAASCFSIYAFSTLKEELQKIKELNFLFTKPTFVEKQVNDNLHRERREFFLNKFRAESGLCGTEFEIKLRNKLTQKAVAKECADWIRDKVTIKTTKEEAPTQSMINLSKKNGDGVNYSPVDGFTAADLGYEHKESRLLNVYKVSDPETVKYVIEEFDDLWNDEEKLKDVKEAVVDYISSCYVENSPEFIYFIILYNVFREFLEDFSEDSMPNEATGFKNSLIWNKLYNFQRDGAIGAINKLEKYNGCILADSVGLGKTFTALAVMHYYSLRNKSILVLCPKRLEQNWRQYIGQTTTNLFYKDRIRFDVLFHTDLSRRSGMSGGINLATVNWGNYDLVVIDESHNFRNNNSVHRDRDTRYDFLMKRIMQDGVSTKVLMLSATPVNNRYNDLKNQLMLPYCGDAEKMSRVLGLRGNVNAIFSRAQSAFNEWSRKPTKERHKEDLLNKLDVDFSIILDSVTIARSRKHIQKFYNTDDIGKFPDYLPVEPLNPGLTDDEEIMTYREIYEQLGDTTMSVYAPLAKLQPSKVSKYEKRYKIDPESEDERARTLGGGLERQINRENGIKRLMVISLLKRLESSVYSFRCTLSAVIKSNNVILEKIKRYHAGERVTLRKKMYMPDDFDDDSDDDNEELYNEYEDRPRNGRGFIEIDFDDLDIDSWEREIKEDVAILSEILGAMELVTPEKDKKLQTLKHYIDEKIDKPFNAGNKKILVFSAFNDTVTYLYDNLAKYIKEKHGLFSAKISGNNENKTNQGRSTQADRLLALFSPISKDKATTYPRETGKIDILFATDCLSEGQNLQDCDICINYDIHWNPVRIIQRFGRIDRIGSLNKTIKLVNFWPDISLDEYIRLSSRVFARMTIVVATATADGDVLGGDEEQEGMNFREEQLKKLQEGSLQDLEDVDGNISITDLGLNDFVMDLAAYIKEHGEPRGVTRGLHAVVAADNERGLERGVIFVLRNVNSDVNIDNRNRLHPYYLVYVKENGEIKYDHAKVKDVFDALRAFCKGKKEPLAKLCRSFNKETKEGVDMGEYSELLKGAVASIVQTKEEDDTESIMDGNTNPIFQQGIKGLDDFELISFVVVR